MSETNVYIRGLLRPSKKQKLTRSEISHFLNISPRSLGRIYDGRLVSANLADRLLTATKTKKWKHRITLEKPAYCLRLFLDRKRKRITRLDHPGFILFDGELLQQTLDGRAFTASFAKKLKKFLRQIPVTPDEYKIVAIDKDFNGKFVEEWKSKRPINGDGDGFLDLKILLREKFDCWAWGPTNYSDQLTNDLAKFGEAKILRLELPKETIQSLNKEEQNMLIAFGSASNELAYLIRLAVVSGHQKCNGKVYDAFALSQTFTVLKLYAGKISECWRLIERRFFNTKLAQKYTQLIREEERTALSKLKKYFSNGNNIVNLIRNEAAFHFSRADLFPALAAISEKKPCTTYLAGPRGYNELFDFCEIAMANHLLSQINRDPQKALRILQNDVGEIGSYMLAFLGGMAFRLIVEATKRCPGKGRTISQSIPLERKKNNSSIPIFIHPPDYRQEYYKLSKALR